MQQEVSKESFGYDRPVNAPLFQKPPFYFRGLEGMTILYETEEEVAQALVPDGLEIPLPATVDITVFSAPFTSVGPYNSAIVRVHCLWQGQPKAYVCYQIVTGDVRSHCRAPKYPSALHGAGSSLHAAGRRCTEDNASGRHGHPAFRRRLQRPSRVPPN